MPSPAHRPHICLATCAALPELDPDEQLVIGPLERRGARVSAVVWDDPAVDWDAFDLVVIRSTWDYTARRDDFVAWARRVPRLANPVDVIAWNTDKRYLDDLAAAGLPVVPTTWLEPGDAVDLPATGVHVIKPSIGAGSIDAARFVLDDPTDAQRARQHAERLLGAGQTVMIQPYLAGIDTHGETGVVLLRGRCSHAIGKGAMLGETERDDVAGLYKAEAISARTPSAAELALAERTVAAVPNATPAQLTYARVDLVPGADGEPLLIELELTEPSLFMGTTAGAEELFADAIMATLAG